MSRTGKFGTGGSAGRTCPVGKPPTPGNGRTCQPDLPIRGEAGQERCGESETQRPVSGVASRSDSETRGEINSPVSRAGGSRPDTGDSKSGPASPGSGQRTTEPWWQSRRSETGSKHCPAESQRLDRDGDWRAGKYATAERQRRTAAVGDVRTDRCRLPRRTGRTQNRPAERQSLGGDGPTGSRGNGPTENQ